MISIVYVSRADRIENRVIKLTRNQGFCTSEQCTRSDGLPAWALIGRGWVHGCQALRVLLGTVHPSANENSSRFRNLGEGRGGTKHEIQAAALSAHLFLCLVFTGRGGGGGGALLLL